MKKKSSILVKKKIRFEVLGFTKSRRKFEHKRAKENKKRAGGHQKALYNLGFLPHRSGGNRLMLNSFDVVHKEESKNKNLSCF